MCGIAGYFGPQNIKNENISQVLKVLTHRGPDGQGVYKKEFKKKKLVFAHTRLKILDLNNRSNQPFEFADSTLIFNGEIYNYLEIKKSLQNLGHKFKTKSDTEVLIHSLKEWGIEKTLKIIEGMWSFAWFDEKDKKLYLARDRFGEKPLFISSENGGIYFSSEIKGIAALKGQKFEKNFEQINRYLNLGFRSLHKTNETFFKNVYEFPKSNFAIYSSDGSIKKKNYWKFKYKKNNYSLEENSENVKKLLINSLKICTRSDVPLAFCLSSGIDSNFLIHAAKKILNLKVEGFSINSKDARYSEKKLLKESLYRKDIKCNYINSSGKNFLSKIESQIIKHDAPISTISYYMQLELLKKMRQSGFKVSISGTGADEIFTGYYDHHILYFSNIFNQKKLLKKSINNWKKYQKNFIRNKFFKDPNLFIKNPNFREYLYQSNMTFKKYFINNFNENFKESKFTNNILRNRMLNELFYEIVPVILHEDDHNAMSVSMENRSPFLDKNLFEYSLTIPTEQLIQNGNSKAILRNAGREIIPKNILNQKKKIGFNLSISEILKKDKKNNIDFLLEKSDIFDIVSKKKIKTFLSKKIYNNSESKFLFNFINCKIFLNHF